MVGFFFFSEKPKTRVAEYLLFSRNLASKLLKVAEGAKKGRYTPETLQDTSSALSTVATHVIAVAATAPDRGEQREVIGAGRDVARECLAVVSACRLASHDTSKADILKDPLQVFMGSLKKLKERCDNIDDAKDIANVLKDLEKTMADLKSVDKNAPNPNNVPYEDAVRTLAQTAQATSAATAQFVQVTQTSPTALSASAKMTALTAKQTVEACICAALASPTPDERLAILEAGKALLGSMTDLIAMSKAAIGKGRHDKPFAYVPIPGIFLTQLQ